MINITIEVDGQPVEPGDLVGSVERSVIKKLTSRFEHALQEGLTPEELSKLDVKLVGSSLSDLQLNLNGPKEVLAKAAKVLRGK